jgi:hypothetical protein
LTCITPIRPLQLCADGDYQPSLGVLEVPLIIVSTRSFKESIHNFSQKLVYFRRKTHTKLCMAKVARVIHPRGTIWKG